MNQPVTREDLRLGEPVKADMFDAAGAVLLRKGTLVESATFVELLLGCGAVFKLDDPPPESATESDAKESVFKTIERLGDDLVGASLHPSETGDFVFTLRSIALELIDTIDRDPDPSIASIFLNACDIYSVRHQIHSAILSVVMARVLDIPLEDLRSLVCGALTMNLAFLEYQDSLNTRPGGLSDDERDMIFKHPQIGEQLLLTAGVTDKNWLSCVRHHHEKWDGSGYPGGLSGKDIPLLAQIVQIVDVFSARISVRSWGHTELANATMADLLRSTAGNHCNPDLVKALVKALGAYPPGCFVRLENGETGIVAHRGHKVMTPRVWSFERNQTPLEPPLLRNTSEKGFAITALLPHTAEKSHPRLEALWEKRESQDSEHSASDSWIDRN